jgi:hypothetical protein
VPLAAVRLDLLEPGDVARLEPPQRPLDEVLAVEDRRDPGDLVVAELLRPPLRVDVQLGTHLQGRGRPQPTDIPQGDVRRLVRRDVNALDTGHGSYQ